MASVLHILDRLSAAGPSRSLISLVQMQREAGFPWCHRLVTLQPEVYTPALLMARRAGLEVRRALCAQEFAEEIEAADLVQLHYWNNPAFLDLLQRLLPAHRRIIWFMIAGIAPPQVITSELVACADINVATASATLRLPALAESCQQVLAERIPCLADPTRLEGFRARPHAGVRAGYLGTTNFSKMHPGFVAMSAATETRDLVFPVAGAGGGEGELQRQAEALGAAARFEFLGFRENIRSVLESLDLFGYPLCSDTYATSEIILQEAMTVGLPPVVFPHGGTPDLVEDGVTGRVVHSPEEYTGALDALARDPSERQRLGSAASRFIRSRFAPEHAAAAFSRLYERAMDLPKRQQGLFAPGLPPCQRFARMLGEAGEPFLCSIEADDRDAERRIASSTFLLAQGEGGLFQFRNAHPEDPWFRYWVALVLAAKGREEAAARERSEALRLGLPASRGLASASDAGTGAGDGRARRDGCAGGGSPTHTPGGRGSLPADAGLGTARLHDAGPGSPRASSSESE